jgi:hypothetical protein
MTPAQQTALQALYSAHGGSTFTAQQVTDLGPMVDRGDHVSVVAYLNPTVPKKTVSTFVTARTVLAAYATSTTTPGAAILDALNTAAASNSTVKWAMSFVTGSGLDMGDPETAAMLGLLVAGGALTQPQADALKALALVDNPIDHLEVGHALSGV